MERTETVATPPHNSLPAQVVSVSQQPYFVGHNGGQTTSIISQQQQQQHSLTFVQPNKLQFPMWQASDIGLVIPDYSTHKVYTYNLIFKALGITQIIVGVLCISLGIALVTSSILYLPGIFGSTWFIISGCLGIAMGIAPSRCKAIAGLMLSIMAALSAVVSASMAILISATSVSGGVAITVSILSCVELVVAITYSVYSCKSKCGQIYQKNDPNMLNVAIAQPFPTMTTTFPTVTTGVYSHAEGL